MASSDAVLAAARVRKWVVPSDLEAAPGVALGAEALASAGTRAIAVPAMAMAAAMAVAYLRFMVCAPGLSGSAGRGPGCGARRWRRGAWKCICLRPHVNPRPVYMRGQA